jgi:DNA-binding NarL/FixJ family response regulator
MTPEQKAAHLRMISTLPKRTFIRMADPYVVTPNMVELWRELHKDGLSYQKIAKMYHRTKNTVMNYCNGRMNVAA